MIGISRIGSSTVADIKARTFKYPVGLLGELKHALSASIRFASAGISVEGML